jgi:hypothetical protein
MKRLLLMRLEKLDDRTLGRLILFNGVEIEATFTTLELPWKNNEKNESCILSGYYTVEPRTSPKYGDHLLVNNTAPRDLILLHVGNAPKDTQGCILIGTGFGDFDKDGRREITESKRAVRRLTELVTGESELIIL